MSTVFPACTTDFEVNAPEKEIRAVYCVLDPADSVQYVRIARAYQVEGDALVFAAENDLSVSGLNVKLTNVNNTNQVFQATEVPNYPKDSGGTFFPGQTIYRFDTDGADTLVPGTRYRLEVGTPEAEDYVMGETTVPDRPRIKGELNMIAGAGNTRCLPRLFLDKKFNFYWQNLGEGIHYEIRVFFEFSANGVGKRIQWGPTDIFDSNKRCNEGSGSICYQFDEKQLLRHWVFHMPEDPFIVYTYDNADSCVSNPSQVPQLPHTLWFEVTAVDEYLSNYIMVNDPKFTDLTGAKPEYTNLSGKIEPVGVFGSINTDLRYAILRECSEALLGLNGTQAPSGCTWDD